MTVRRSFTNKAVVIGAGFSGLSAACFLAKDGWDVTVLEKHDSPGGRARQLREGGFTFDMGPSWYWMPEVFERFFNAFGKQAADYYNLVRLDPSYRVIWKNAVTDIPAGKEAVAELFESWESGSARKLTAFLTEAAFKYDAGMNRLVYKPGRSLAEFLDTQFLRGLLRLDVFSSMRNHVSRYFTDARIRQLMEFPVLFLGAAPQDTPALYSLMNYADIEGGTWYPRGGMYSVVKAMSNIAEELGVKFHFCEEVTAFSIDNKQISKVHTSTGSYIADLVISSADYHHVEHALLQEKYRSYSSTYWESIKMAPSCFIYYVGVNKKLKNIRHHQLFFDTPFEDHSMEIFSSKRLPAEPLFYVSVTSVTDNTVAPEGCENIFFLIPVAAGIAGDSEEVREHYFGKIIDRFEKYTGEKISENIIYKKSYAHSDFVNDYHSFKGNAYGLANTLRQTAILKPSIRSKKVNNLYYTGQLTVPGPGVPPSIISGEVVASYATSKYKKQRT